MSENIVQYVIPGSSHSLFLAFPFRCGCSQQAAFVNVQNMTDQAFPLDFHHIWISIRSDSRSPVEELNNLKHGTQHIDINIYLIFAVNIVSNKIYQPISVCDEGWHLHMLLSQKPYAAL